MWIAQLQVSPNSVKVMLISANFTALVDSLVANRLDDVLNATGQPRWRHTQNVLPLKKNRKWWIQIKFREIISTSLIDYIYHRIIWQGQLQFSVRQTKRSKRWWTTNQRWWKDSMATPPISSKYLCEFKINKLFWNDVKINCRRFLHYHVVPRKIMPADIHNDMTVTPFLKDKQLRFNVYGTDKKVNMIWIRRGTLHTP